MPTFSCRFTATKLDGSVVRRSFRNIKAANSYAATDEVKKLIGREYDEMYNPRFKFGGKGVKLSAAVINAANAGLSSPEEE